MGKWTAGYSGGEEMPLGGYAALLLFYGGAVSGLLLAMGRRRRARVSAIGAPTIALAGVATHKLTRTITRDWVTAPMRAPFTRFEKSLGGGEVQEKSRGAGLRRAVGDLVTCPFCTGPWVAAALLGGIALAPNVARFVIGVFTAVTVSDFLHRGYDWLSHRVEPPRGPLAEAR